MKLQHLSWNRRKMVKKVKSSVRTRNYLQAATGINKVKVIQAMEVSTLFTPGLFLIAFAVVVLIAPQFVLMALGGFLLFLGVAACVVARKILKLRARFQDLTKNFEARIVLQGTSARQFAETEILDKGSDQKKVILH